MRLDGQLSEAEQDLNRTKNELNDINSNYLKEKRAHEEFEEKAEQLQNDLNERNIEIKRMNNDLMTLSNNVEKLNQDKLRSNNDIGKYQNHIKFLTESNQNLMRELEAAYERNCKLRQINVKGKGMKDLINQTKSNLNQALDHLEISLSRPRSPSSN